MATPQPNGRLVPIPADLSCEASRCSRHFCHGLLGYLDKPNLHRYADPELFDFLHHTIHRDHDRRTTRIETAGLLRDATFHSCILSDDLLARQAYFAECKRLFQDRDLVFFDPDNGLERRSIQPGHQGSAKYLYWNEVLATYSAGSSVLIYQHFPREPRVVFTANLVRQMEAKLEGATVVPFATSHVLFLLAAQPRHQDQLVPRTVQQEMRDL